MLSGEPRRRRRVLSTDAVESLRLKNSRSGYLSKVTQLFRSIEELQQDTRNVDEASEKILALKEAFGRFQRAHFEYVATLRDDPEAWDEEARYFREHCRRRVEFEQSVKQWIDSAAPVAKTQEVLDIAPEDSISAASSRRSQASSNLSIRALKTKQAMAHLKMQQLEKKHRLLRQEEEIKLQRQILDAQYEIEQADLRVELFETEENTGLTQPRFVSSKFFPCKEESKFASQPEVVKTEEWEPRSYLPREIDRNYYSEEFVPRGEPLANDERSSNPLPIDLLDRMALTIKQGFALPKPELPTFDGNPLEYWNFIKSFETNIERNATSESEKLMYLLQYTSGDARKTIKCCLVMDQSVGYQNAKKLLKERFGHPFVIASKYVAKLTEGPPLKPTDRSGLLTFADQLKDCEHTLRSIGYLDEVNSADNLRRIVQKLPFHLRAKFIEVADGIQQSGQRTNIGHIADFVKVKARAANNPVFGSIIDVICDRAEHSAHRTSSGPSPFKRVTTLSTQVTSDREGGQRRAGCPACDGPHSLLRCQIFETKTFEERLQIMRKAHLCHNCFKYGHIAVGCLAKSACQIPGCTRRHHTLLHPPGQQQSLVSSAPVAEKPVDSSSPISSPISSGQTHSASANEGKVCLRVVPVKVRSRDSDKTVVTYALLDNGSDVSLCDNDLAVKLGVQGKLKTFYLTTQEKEDSPKVGREISLTIEALDGVEKITVPRLWTVDKLNASKRSIPSQEDVKQWPHLQDIVLPSIDESEIKLIIGSNVPDAFWVLDERRGERGEPYAIRSPLGWTLIGPTDRAENKSFHVNFVRLTEVTEKDDDRLMHQLEQFWKIENYGLSPNSKESMSLEDKRALAVMENSATMVDGHYQVALPWREPNPYLPNNRSMAERRLFLLKKRLLQDSKLFDGYKATMENYLDKGHARRVPDHEMNAHDKPLWYLPHHPVFNKPGKTRVVFDCAAKYGGTSLNDQLLSGPDLTNSIVGVLTRFRENPVALAADIECMFHQVRVPPADRDAFRFLWWPNSDLSQDPVDHRMEVHLFGATSSPSCSNFALRKTAQDNKDEYAKDIVKTVKRNFYIDDCLKSVESSERAVYLAVQLSNLLAKGGFRLTKWLCNRPEVLESIPKDERAPSVLDLDLDKDKLPLQRALGLKWDMESDKFTFAVVLKDKPSTRRGILSLTSSIYDPLGFLVPIILPAKKLLQDLCKQKLGWDDPVSKVESQRWEIWKEKLPSLAGMGVNRCVRPIDFGELRSFELHNFADASQIAYGAVSYLRMTDVESKIHCAFLMGKSRLAHLKPMTVPRLELLAAVLAVQINKTLVEELDIPVTRSIFWTDSTCVLQYIRNTSKRFHTFVANRLAVIHENSKPHQWRHVRSDLNPADDASRGLTIEEMHAKDRWFGGPQFLRQKEEFWPPDLILCQPELTDEDPEIKRTVQLCCLASTNSQEVDVVSRLIERYSSWEKLRKAIAWILGFKIWFIGRYLRSPAAVTGTTSSVLSVEEVCSAEKEIFKHVQRSVFPEVIKALQQLDQSHPPHEVNSKLKNSKIPSSMRKLHPQLDDSGILRVGGRLENAQVNYEIKHPIIMPYRHRVTELIILQHHQQVRHLGQEYVLSSLHQLYWIIKGRSAVRRVIRDCFLCKKLGAIKGEQLMANLPKERVIPGDPPFTHVGVDYFGPLYVRQGRSSVKRYGCLFSCLVIRAVHIEIVHSLDTDAFINALRRLINLRGKPETIYSDNGTNLRAGEREIRESLATWNQSSIHEFLRQKNITWKFNPPTASHMGGVWERMIRSVRKILRALLGEQLVSDESLRTMMTEVQSILNSRPLTPVSSDPKDLEPITPNHLLLLRSNANFPPGIFSKEDMYTRRRWRQVQYLSNVFWKRWLKEYLPTLQERKKWLKPRRCLSVGDLVLIVDENVHRGRWPLARVIEVFQGKDGFVRSAKVRTSLATFVRPVTKLCFLESDKELSR